MPKMVDTTANGKPPSKVCELFRRHAPRGTDGKPSAEQLRAMEREIAIGDVPTISEADIRAVLTADPDLAKKLDADFPCWGADFCTVKEPCNGCSNRRRYIAMRRHWQLHGKAPHPADAAYPDEEGEMVPLPDDAPKCLKSLSAGERDDSEAAPFPLHVFPEALQRFIGLTAAAIPCPLDYIAVSALAVVSSFIGAGRPMRIKRGWEERPSIYAAIVGPTGSRKSPALEQAMLPARKHDRQLADEYRRELKEYEVRREEAKDSGTDLDESRPLPKQHVTVDTTVEALADVLTWNPRGLLVYRDEATGWVTSLNQYKAGQGSDRQFWLSAWSCQDYTVNRKGKEPLRLVRPFLSVIGNIPPDMLGELADRRGRQDGFLDRILFSFPNPVTVKWTETTVDEDLEKSYVQACLEIGKLPDAVLTLTQGGQLAFSRWYDLHNANLDGPAGSWAKMDGYCARFANILHHLKGAYGTLEELGDEVDADSVNGAVALVDYFKNHARRALGRMKVSSEDRLLGRLLSFVVNTPGYRVRPRALIAAQIAGTADEAKALLQRLATMGLGVIVPGKRKDEIIFQGRKDLEEAAQQIG